MARAAIAYLALLSAAGLLGVALASNSECEAHSECEDEDHSALQKTVVKRPQPRVLTSELNGLLQKLASTAVAEPQSYEECTLGNSDCTLAAMNGKRTYVYPGGDTRCFNGDPYAFAVVPGDTDKLLFYFEGGGACWEAGGNVVKACTDSLSYAMSQTGFGKGIQNSSDERNPFKSYTVVEPLYCSGDAFAGNAKQHWDDETVYQHGYHNALAAAEWTVANFPGDLASLVISGYSAGSLGTMAWAGWLLKRLPHRRATVLADSYAGIFPPGTEENVIQAWKTCDTGLWSPVLNEKCKSGSLKIKDVFEEAMGQHPEAAFAHIQSKIDAVQRTFYSLLAQSYGMGPEEVGLSPQGFYAKTAMRFEEYNRRFPNYIEMFVDGETHVFTGEGIFYSASTAGWNDPTGVTMYSWVQRLVDEVDVAASACLGLLVPDVNVPGGAKYCYEHLYPKVAVVNTTA